MLLLLTLLFLPAQAGGDNDGDGVLNRHDACPQAAEDLDGFEDTDGCPDLDNDRDGIPDRADSCPSHPEDLDGFQDGDGCPDPDNDSDGMADVEDPCPNEPGSRGCPADSDAVIIPFSKLTIAITAKDAEAAAHAFQKDAWQTNLVGSSGLSGEAIYTQGSSSRWSLVPTAPPLMVSPQVALVPCSIQSLDDQKELDRVIAVVVSGELGWRILGAGENEEQVRTLATTQANTLEDPKSEHPELEAGSLTHPIR